jgi:molecular chaperone DnaK (HSP70)
MYILGIDYGNDNIKLSHIINNQINIILNSESNRKFKNLINIKNKTYFDNEAENFFITNYNNNIYNIKLALNYNNKSNSFFIKKKQYTHEQILSMQLNFFLKYIKKNNDIHIYFSIPGYFDLHQRSKILDACKINNIYNIKLINDENSIATNYGFYNYLNDNQFNKHIIFIDIGDSHFKIFLVSYTQNSYKIIKSKYSNEIGGQFINTEIVNFIKQQFCIKNNIEKINLKSELKIFKECDKIKRNLNLNKCYTFKNDYFHKDYSIHVEINENDYKNILTNTLKNIKWIITDFIHDIKDYDNIELIGGTSRVLLIQSEIKKILNTDIQFTLNSDEAIARGLNLISAIKTPEIIMKEYLFDYNNTNNIYMNINNQKKIIFKKNEILPSNIIKDYQIDNKKNIFIQTNDVKIPIQINENIQNINIKIHFILDTNQIIHIKEIYYENENGKNNINFNFNINLIEEDINKIREINEQIYENDNQVDLLNESQNKLEKLYYQYIHKIEDDNYKKYFINNEIETLQEKLEEIINDIDNQDINIIQERIKKLNSLGEYIKNRIDNKKSIELKYKILQKNIDKCNSNNIEVSKDIYKFKPNLDIRIQQEQLKILSKYNYELNELIKNKEQIEKQNKEQNKNK